MEGIKHIIMEFAKIIIDSNHNKPNSVKTILNFTYTADLFASTNFALAATANN